MEHKRYINPLIQHTLIEHLTYAMKYSKYWGQSRGGDSPKKSLCSSEG